MSRSTDRLTSTPAQCTGHLCIHNLDTHKPSDTDLQLAQDMRPRMLFWSPGSKCTPAIPNSEILRVPELPGATDAVLVSGTGTEHTQTLGRDCREF